MVHCTKYTYNRPVNFIFFYFSRVYIYIYIHVSCNIRFKIILDSLECDVFNSGFAFNWYEHWNQLAVRNCKNSIWKWTQVYFTEVQFFVIIWCFQASSDSELYSLSSECF
jgi:hypothetical protein